MSTLTKTYSQAVAPSGDDQRVANQSSSDKKQTVGAKPSSKRQPNKSYSSAASAGVSQTSNAISAVGAGASQEQTHVIPLDRLERLKTLFDQQDSIRKERTAITTTSVVNKKRVVHHTWAHELELQTRWYAVYQQLLDEIDSLSRGFDLDATVARWYPDKKPTRPYLQRFEEEYNSMKLNYGYYKRWYKSKDFGTCKCAQCTPPTPTAAAVSVQQDTTPASDVINSQPTPARVAPSRQMEAAHAGLQSCIADMNKFGNWGDWMLDEDDDARRR